ncbi:hypothetical protein [Chryseobacterium sp. T1]
MSRLVTSICIMGVFLVKGQSISDINANNIMAYYASGSLMKIIEANTNSASLVIQKGNNNNTEISLIDDKVAAMQLGDNNAIFYQDKNAAQSSTMSISLQGDNNLVEVLGSNSISNGMSIEIIGNDKTVLVENK